MTVKELIDTLSQFDPELPVVYSSCSEFVTLEAQEITVLQLQPSRNDGWVHTKWPGSPEVVTVPTVAFP